MGSLVGKKKDTSRITGMVWWAQSSIQRNQISVQVEVSFVLSTRISFPLFVFYNLASTENDFRKGRMQIRWNAIHHTLDDDVQDYLR